METGKNSSVVPVVPEIGDVIIVRERVVVRRRTRPAPNAVREKPTYEDVFFIVKKHLRNSDDVLNSCICAHLGLAGEETTQRRVFINEILRIAGPYKSGPLPINYPEYFL